MPTFSVVPVEQAQLPAVGSKRALLLGEYQGFIEQIGSRQAGSLTPEYGETTQAVRRRLRAAAKLSGVALTAEQSGRRSISGRPEGEAVPAHPDLQ